MMKTQWWQVVALAVACIGAQPALGAESGDAEQVRSSRKWGIETSLVFPLVNIYVLRGSYLIWDHGEVLIGAALQRWSNDEFDFASGQAEAYTLLLGYRQYLWRGLHLEVMLFPSYNRFHSNVDNRVYAGLELWMEMYVGYKFRFEVSGVGLFVVPQVGFGLGVAKQKEWPQENLPTGLDRLMFVPNILVGVEF